MEVIKNQTVAIRATIAAPVSLIKNIEPKNLPDPDVCQVALNVGIFFDGTKNNRRPYENTYGYSNVARLYEAYPKKEESGFHCVYIPGVGTQFPELGEFDNRNTGSAFASGATERVLYALLSIFNAFYKQAFLGCAMFSAAEVLAICAGKTDGAELAEKRLVLGIESDLRDHADDGMVRQKFLMEQQARLQELLETESKIRLVECSIDVFGFSRGAAKARVFCHWFSRLLKDGKFAGVPVTFRFLGIMDTVASAGFLDGVLGAITNSTGGHNGWAAAKSLVISPEVKNCVHMVAMHELRKNFPLDEVAVDAVLPSNCQEIAYPGSHSDVGGGYHPGALGIAIGDTPEKADSLKLAQIPLNHMYECAVAAGVPISKVLAQQEGYDPFAVAPQVEQAYKAFLKELPSKPQLLSEWMRPYLAWRWQMRDRYATLQHVKAAKDDRQLLLDSNAALKADGERLALLGDVDLSDRFVIEARTKKWFSLKNPEYKQEDFATMDPEAPTVLKQAIAYGPVSPVLADFFDTYVHDSLAGFRKDLVESTGYWRYRRTFRGDDVVQLSQQGGQGTTPVKTSV